MATFVALYAKPDDVAGFDEHFRNTHLPLVQSWPGATSVRVTRFSATPRDTDAAFYLKCEVEWPTDEEMAAALRSDGGMGAAKDAMVISEQFGVAPTMLLGDDF